MNDKSKQILSSSIFACIGAFILLSLAEIFWRIFTLGDYFINLGQTPLSGRLKMLRSVGVACLLVGLVVTIVLAAERSMALPATTAAKATKVDNKQVPEWWIGEFEPSGTHFGKYPDGTCVLTVAPNKMTFFETSSGPEFSLTYDVIVSNENFIVIKAHGVVDDSKALCFQGDPSVEYLRIDRNICQTSHKERCGKARLRFSPYLNYAFIWASFDKLQDALAVEPPELLLGPPLPKGENWGQTYYVFTR